jgi:Arc/MetJ family transcription regulator
MRTTIEINDELLRQAKRRAADEALPLRAIVERALQSFLGIRRAGGVRYRLELGSHGGGIQPGVSLEDWNALRDRMDE